MRVVLPGALMRLEEPNRTGTLVRVRRRFKLVIHTSILLLVVSGIYNSTGNWGAYARFRPLSDELWGGHVALAVLIFTIALVLLAGRLPPRRHKGWTIIILALMGITLAVAATLKYERESHTLFAPPAAYAVGH